MIYYKVYAYNDDLKVQNFLGDFTDLLSAKETIKGFHRTQYNVINDNDAFIFCNTFDSLKKTGNLLIVKQNTIPDEEEGRGEVLFGGPRSRHLNLHN